MHCPFLFLSGLTVAVVGAAVIPPPPPPPPPPPTSYYNGTLLAYSKQLVAKQDPSVFPSYQALISAANNALSQTPLSVTQKYNASLYPFQMSPQDYVSVGFYFWPCNDPPPGQKPPPKGTCNETSGLPWVDYDGGNEAYAAKATQLVRAWFTSPTTGMNPNFDHGQFVPGVNSGRGTGLIDFSEYFGSGFIDSFVFLRVSASWTTADENDMQNWCKQLVEWILTSPIAAQEAASINNHKAWFEAQLLHLAFYTGNTSLASSRAATEGLAVLNYQVAPDGELPLEEARTRSLHYVSFCLHAYIGLANACANSGFDLYHYITVENHTGIEAAISFSLPFNNGSQVWPFENLDGWAWTWSEYFDLYRIAAYVYPAQASTFLTAIQSSVNTTKGDDLRRLVWPYPGPN